MSLLRLLSLIVLSAFWATAASAQIVPAQTETAPEAAEAPDVSQVTQQLIDVLQDPATRDAFIAQLQGASVGADPTVEPAPEAGIAGAIADQTLGAAETVSDYVVGAVDRLSDWEGLVETVEAVNWSLIGSDALSIGLVAVVTIGAFLLLRAIGLRIGSAIARRTPGAGLWRSLLGLIPVAIVDLAMIVLAWAAGYGLALWLGDGNMDFRQSLFLNAFLVVEVSKLALRLVLSPYRPELRLWSMPDAAAREWYRYPARIIALLGYGGLLLVPIAARALSPAFAQGLQVAIVLLAALMAVRLILRNRVPVRNAMRARAAHGSGGIVSAAFAILAEFWHILAILYVIGLLIVWSAQPANALGYMLLATAKSAGAIVLGTIAMLMITRAMVGGVRLSENVKARLPMLEGRVNALVPNFLNLLRIVLFLVVVGLIAEAWSLFDFGGWLSGEMGQRTVRALISASMILVVTGVIWLAVSSWIEFKLNPRDGRVVTPRESTLLSLARNAFTILVVVMGAMLTLSAIGVNIAPLLAGAGVVGLAIGFGAQKLVQDIITGAFIQFENAMNTGDVVTAGGITGVVEKLTIRSVGLRALDGTYHVVPFSSVDTVSNLMKDFSYHVAEMGVAYREDVGEVKALMQTAFERLKETDHGREIIAPLDMQGLVAFGDSAVMVRARIMTLPGKQWGVGRAYNEILKQVFDAANIEIPFPHMTLYMGEDRKGNAPPLNLRRAPRAAEEPRRSRRSLPRPTARMSAARSRTATSGDGAGPRDPADRREVSRLT